MPKKMFWLSAVMLSLTLVTVFHPRSPKPTRYLFNLVRQKGQSTNQIRDRNCKSEF